MNKPTINVGNFSFVILLFLLFLLPLNVGAQENSVSPASLTENSRINVTVSLAQYGIETAPSNITVAATMSVSAVPTPITTYSLSSEIAANSSNLALKESQFNARVNANQHVFITDSRTGQKYVKDRVIVRFKSQKNAESSISQEKISMAHAKMGAKVEKEFSTGGVAGLQLVQLPNGTDIQSAISAYESNPDVLYAEPDYVLSILPDQTGPIVLDTNPPNILSIPNDGDFSYQWSFHNTGQTGGTPGADIKALAAWDISTGSNSVVVAVIDTGVLYNHSDLSANIWDNTGEIPGNGIDDDDNGYIDDIRGWDFVNADNDPIDDQKHGTHVSGTIGAVGNNAIGVAGVNWQVKIMPLKAFDQYGQGSTSDAIEAIKYANANGASVISNSWGGPDYSQGLEDAINASPAVVVCAAGNFARNNDQNPLYPTSYNSPNIISVAATDQNDFLAPFSNFGLSSVDLAAPGTNIWSTYLDGNYYSMSGTSMATPHVSGVAALVKAVNPRLSTRQIKNIILNNVDVKSSLFGKVNTSGRLNAFKSVIAARNIAQPEKMSVFLNGGWWRDTKGNGIWEVGDEQYTFGSPGVQAVTGDWNGDGKDESGVFLNGGWWLDANGNGTWDTGDEYYTFGSPGVQAVTGDWNGDGKDESGVFLNGGWWLDANADGIWNAGDVQYTFGSPGVQAVTGDWNRDGKDEVGVFLNGGWWLDANGDGIWDTGDEYYTFGSTGCQAVSLR
jgi:subtilisin family serine protease